MASFRLSPFIFVICLCAVLGVALLFVPFITFKSENVLDTISYGHKQVIVHQKDRFRALVVESSQDKTASVYVFDSNHLPKITNDTWQEISARSKTLAPHEALTIEFYTHNGTVGSFIFSPSNSSLKIEVDGHAINDTVYQANFTDFGKHTAALRNVGKQSINAKLTVVLSTPYYDVINATAVAKCEGHKRCKLQHLPKGYAAFVNISLGSPAAAVTVTAVEQYDDLYRWMFPLLIYTVLFLIVVITGVAQCIYIKKFKNHSYTAIN